MLNSEDLEFGIAESFGNMAHVDVRRDFRVYQQVFSEIAIVDAIFERNDLMGPTEVFPTVANHAHLVMRRGYLELLALDGLAQMAATSVALSQVLDHGSSTHDVQELRSTADSSHWNLVLQGHLED